MSDGDSFRQRGDVRKPKRTKAQNRGPGTEVVQVYVSRELRNRVRSHRRSKRISQSKLVLKWILEGLERDEGK